MTSEHATPHVSMEQLDCFELEAIPFVMLPSCGRQKDVVYGFGLEGLILFNIWHCACVSSVFCVFPFFFFFFYDEVYFKVVGSRHPGAPRKSPGFIKTADAEALARVFFFFAK